MTRQRNILNSRYKFGDSTTAGFNRNDEMTMLIEPKLVEVDIYSLPGIVFQEYIDNITSVHSTVFL